MRWEMKMKTLLPPLDAVLTGKALWTVRLGDAVETMRSMPSESVDLIVTDHAYESLEKHRAIGSKTRLKVSEGSNNQWFPFFPDARLPELLAECHRVLKKDRHIYMIVDVESMFTVKPLGVDAGFRFCNLVIWDKEATGMGWRWREGMQPVVMWEKGTRQMNYKGWKNMIPKKRLKGEHFYPTQKPLGLNARIILNSSNRGDVVLDPFCGSSSAGVDALLHGRRFIGVDVAPDAIIESAGNLAGETDQFGVIPDPPRTPEKKRTVRPSAPSAAEATA